MMCENPMLAMPSERDVPEVVVLADGDWPSGRVAAALLRQARCVVCCDGAARRYLAGGGMPYAIVGDCDSLDPAIAARHAGLVHRIAEQDTNDQTKAVRFCLERGMRRIVILGATGRREDHTLGNVSLLADYAAEGAEVRTVTDHGVFDPLAAGTTRIASRAGQQVSLFAFDPATRIGGEGLKYALPERLRLWWVGTLNESVGESFTLRVSQPALLFRVF